MKPKDLLEKLRTGVGDVVPVDLHVASVAFVADEELLYTPHEVLTHRSKLRDADSEAFWNELLNQPRSWLHVNLLIDTDGHPVVSLRAGPRVAPQDGVETPIAVSADRLRLRILE